MRIPLYVSNLVHLIQQVTDVGIQVVTFTQQIFVCDRCNGSWSTRRAEGLLGGSSEIWPTSMGRTDNTNH